MFIKYLIICALLFTTSCASILSGTTETIYVRSEVAGTKLYFNNDHVGTDWAKVTVSKKRLKGASFRAEKEGCVPKAIEIETKFDKASLLGFFIDLGIVSVLIVDWGIYGSIREAEHLNYILNPSCGP